MYAADSQGLAAQRCRGQVFSARSSMRPRLPPDVSPVSQPNVCGRRTLVSEDNSIERRVPEQMHRADLEYVMHYLY